MVWRRACLGCNWLEGLEDDEDRKCCDSLCLQHEGAQEYSCFFFLSQGTTFAQSNLFDEHEDDERGRENVARGQNGDMTGAMDMDDIWIPLLAMVFLLILFGVQPRTNQKVFFTQVQQCVSAFRFVTDLVVPKTETETRLHT